MSLQVCGWAVGAEGYLRMTVPGDLSASCRADPVCLASSLAQIRIDRSKLVDGIHPTKEGERGSRLRQEVIRGFVNLCPVSQAAHWHPLSKRMHVRE